MDDVQVATKSIRERLLVLDQRLQDARDNDSFWVLVKNAWLVEVSQNGLEKAIRSQARDYLREMRTIRSKIEKIDEKTCVEKLHETLRQAWKDYGEIQDKSRMLLRNCIEVLGGLMFRCLHACQFTHECEAILPQDTMKACHAMQKSCRRLSGATGGVCQIVQNEICRISDGFAKECSGLLHVGTLAPAMPAYSESRMHTSGRIVRLHFPDWAIWAVPLTAYDVANIALSDPDDGYKAEIEKYKKKWERVARKDIRYVFKLLTDALAIHTIGPSYAQALIRLQFNPSRAMTEDKNSPSEAVRAQVMFDVLNPKKSETGRQQGEDYSDVPEKLKKFWESLLRGVGVSEDSFYPLKEDEEKLFHEIWDKVKKDLPTVAGYLKSSIPKSQVTGWSSVTSYTEQWFSMNFASENVDGPSTLRDILNTAWQCRTTDEEGIRLDSIAEVASSLCNKKINESRPSPPGKPV
ncbi:MAG: hypothetical protein WAN11_20140 [Syntrophobacteraceae bacterium]